MFTDMKLLLSEAQNKNGIKDASGYFRTWDINKFVEGLLLWFVEVQWNRTHNLSLIFTKKLAK